MSFLQPPYLYLLTNLIILTLLISSRLQPHNSDHHHSPTINLPQVSTENGVVMLDHDEAECVDVKPVLVNGIGVTNCHKELRHVISSSPNDNQLQRNNTSTNIIFPSSEKPLATSGRRIERKLRVAHKEETLESAWKRIMEGRRQVNALSDTWQHHVDGSLALIKEASLSKDELNQRAEAFIHQVNHDMRRQRQESLEQKMLTLGGSR